jgi:mannose/fructose/N-acetylgalactosamine-specific phosphotransferase system component IID
MNKLFKWLLIKVVVGGLVTSLAFATIIALILWFILWPFVYLIKLISVNVDRNGEYISKKDWDDWIG